MTTQYFYTGVLMTKILDKNPRIGIVFVMSNLWEIIFITFNNNTMSFNFFSSVLIKKPPALDLENFPLWQQMWNLILSLYIPSSSSSRRERTKEKEKKICPYARRYWYVLRCALHIEVIAFFKSQMFFHTPTISKNLFKPLIVC